ncbi:hypothetical protein HCN44_005090 [Aphidius gifuensis]|uniref:Neprilysin n=1 Tax=Aphidius gifuensis TaxID=684658 RepID=A0A834XXR4_APHGI|nr:hypothetical protein HCN44_005090 [Aphidius gifuensis]
MKSNNNNEYLKSAINAEENTLLEAEMIHSAAPLQVTCANGGTITKILKSSNTSSKLSINNRSNSVTMKKRQKLIGVFAIILLATCLLTLLLLVLNRSQKCSNENNVCLTEECIKTASSLLSAMDRSVSPCVDFFQYACGTWNLFHTIPEDRSSINPFEVLSDQLQVVLKKLLEEPSNHQDNNATLKAKMFYKSCMDIQQIRRIGDKPLVDVLKELGGWPIIEGPSWKPPKFTIEELLGRLRGDFNEGVLLEQWVGPDDKNSSSNIIQLDQMQLALPSRDYYLEINSEIELRAYHRYMTQVSLLLGADYKLAVDEFKPDRHDTSLIYKKLSIRQLQRQVPQFNWRIYIQEFLGELNVSDDEQVVVYSLPYFIQMGRIIEKTDQRTLHNYILWRFVMSLMPYMIDDYQLKRMEFRKVLLGILSEKNRWSQCVEWTNKKLGMAVGALFIRDNFNHESKETALEMIHTIREAFNELLVENDWMDDETRDVAKNKANSMNERIGYPDFLNNPDELNKEYSMLNMTENEFFKNVIFVLKYDAQYNIQKLREPVDKDKWSTEPAVVNAFYNPNKNDIVFPAGILQPLFYSQQFPKSLNYGGIGVVIGHEITHGFDDKGRQFDKEGNMMQWWNNATIKAFRERAQCIVDQYSRYKLREVDQYIDGRMTQGENIADNGGLKQSFRAYKKWVAVHGEEPLLPGINLTHDQLFFLNYAQIWCGSMTPEDALTKIRSSVHSPGPFRVLGALSNSEDFAKAYNCSLGSKMNPTHKCSVW